MSFNFSGVNVLWDNDATLVDSEIIAMPHAVASVFAYFESRGFERNIPSARERKIYEVQWAGKQISQMFEIVEGWVGHQISDEERAALCADDAARVIEALKEVQVIVGIPEALAEVRDGGGTNSVVTSSSLLRVVPGLVNNDLVEFFTNGDSDPRIWSATETLQADPRYGRAIPKSSQSPQIYHYALEATNAQPGLVVAIEDSGSGVGAAVAAGIPVIGITAASHILPKARDAHAQGLIDKASEVLGRPATSKDILVVDHAYELSSAIGHILELPPLGRVMGISLDGGNITL